MQYLYAEEKTEAELNVMQHLSAVLRCWICSHTHTHTHTTPSFSTYIHNPHFRAIVEELLRFRETQEITTDEIECPPPRPNWFVCSYTGMFELHCLE